jgi:Rod binding domain-containing protein
MTGEGGVGRADIIYRDVSEAQKELPIEDQGRYPYMLSKSGQKRMKGITEGIAGEEDREQVGRSANELLTDFTRRKQLISLDPKSTSRYGIKPSLSTIL